MLNPPLKYHRQNERGKKKCIGCFSVKEDLLLLASKAQSLSWLDTGQPVIGYMMNISKPFLEEYKQSCTPVMVAGQLATPCKELQQSWLKDAQLTWNQKGSNGSG